MSTNSTRFIADHSGHGTPEKEPRLEVEAIRFFVDEYRSTVGIAIPTAQEVMDASAHVPVITKIAKHKRWQNGTLFVYVDFSFSDPAGDAITIISYLVS